MQYREMADDPELWLSKDVISKYDSEWWASAFVKTYFQNLTPHSPILSYHDFILSRWLWVTDGATRFSTAKLDDELVRTKFGAALSLSDEELLQHANLEHESSFEIGIFLKPDEPGYKRRLIANVSLGPYLLAAYIRYYLEHTLKSNPSFYKLDVEIIDREQIIELIKSGRTSVPLDESAYDYHVSKESWDGFSLFLKSIDPHNKAFTLFHKYKNTAHWSFEGKRGLWSSGMPSGLALTSFLNSWMNYIKQAFILEGDLQYAAGDDVLTVPRRNGVDLLGVADAYEDFGSAVNATKNWIAQRYAEYLKVLYHGRGATGYPARVFSSLIWAGKERTFLPSDKLPELAELFKQFYDRLGQPLDVKEVSSDLSRAVSQKVEGFSREVAEDWLFSPRAYGGFGMLPYRTKYWDWEVEVLKKKQYTGVIIKVPDVNFYATSVKLIVRDRALHVNRNYAVGPPLRLPVPNSLEAWERRLNGEDNPIKGKFGRMALDVIPLPTIDGVSTAVTANLARKWNYHVLPNIRGSSDTIVDALVLASLALVGQIKSFLSDRGIDELAN